ATAASGDGRGSAAALLGSRQDILGCGLPRPFKDTPYVVVAVLLDDPRSGWRSITGNPRHCSSGWPLLRVLLPTHGHALFRCHFPKVVHDEATKPERLDDVGAGHEDSGCVAP